MRWAFGYLLLSSICSAKLVVDFLPIARNLEMPSPTWQAWRVLTGYVFALAVLSEILPGKITMGAVLNDSTHRLQYKVNGLLLLGLTIVSLAACVWNGYVRGSWIADHHAELFASANVLALLVSTYLFVVGRLSRPKNWLRPRSVYEDFIMGAELNPHILGVDIKFFSYRPSMIGWLLINLSFLCKQYDTLGFVTSRMLLYQVLTAWYVWDYFVHESKMVYTWDIIAEHFGLMLIWGDYVFIPFAFSIQNFFLLRDLRPMSYGEVILILVVFTLGFAIFRGANSQKHKFKTNPQELIWGKPPIIVGGRLLASGFWGMARHMNYTGDLLLAVSYCLPCGVSAGCVPYFYFIYLLLLVVHREKRDDERCSAKYKSLWEEYCLRVPYRMVPFVY
jgi:Delta14-sterol reductase